MKKYVVKFYNYYAAFFCQIIVVPQDLKGLWVTALVDEHFHSLRKAWLNKDKWTDVWDVKPAWNKQL